MFSPKATLSKHIPNPRFLFHVVCAGVEGSAGFWAQPDCDFYLMQPNYALEKSIVVQTLLWQGGKYFSFSFQWRQMSAFQMAVCALGAQATVAYFSIKPPEATLGCQELYHPRIASRQVGFSQYTEPQLLFLAGFPWCTGLCWENSSNEGQSCTWRFGEQRLRDTDHAACVTLGMTMGFLKLRPWESMATLSAMCHCENCC